MIKKKIYKRITKENNNSFASRKKGTSSYGGKKGKRAENRAFLKTRASSTQQARGKGEREEVTVKLKVGGY